MKHILKFTKNFTLGYLIPLILNLILIFIWAKYLPSKKFSENVQNLIWLSLIPFVNIGNFFAMLIIFIFVLFWNFTPYIMKLIL